MFISIGKVASIMGVACSTLRRWDKREKMLPAFRTPGGHRRYRLAAVLAFCSGTVGVPVEEQDEILRQPRAVLYARVSATRQKDDLQRQEHHLEDYIRGRGWQLVKRYKDIGSGLNGRRKGLLAMMRDLPVLQPDYLVCSYSER